jgi:hypothetical protein
MNISEPTFARTHPDYRLACEKAMDLPLQDLIDQAAQAGWDTRMVIAAIESVAVNKSIAYEEDPDPEDEPGETDPSTPEFGTFPVE